MERPTKATNAGQAFLALRSKALSAGRTTAEYLRLYALEGFLLRLANSSHKNRFVLKGGVLLAAYELRRPTADVDLAAIQTPNEVEFVRELVADIAATRLPEGLDDGLIFDLNDVRAETIREGETYGGVRVRLVAHLVTAREPFHVDVNVGDPIWPPPADISLPRLLDVVPIRLRGYPMEMVLAEKIVTAIQRGPANTRWRDFGDIYRITREHSFLASDVAQAVQAVAEFRKVGLSSLDETFKGYAEIGQPRWAPWRTKLQLAEPLPPDFGDVLEALQAFANPILTGTAAHSATWNPGLGMWEHADSDR
jgi:hypothetical protein